MLRDKSIAKNLYTHPHLEQRPLRVGEIIVIPLIHQICMSLYVREMMLHSSSNLQEGHRRDESIAHDTTVTER